MAKRFSHVTPGMPVTWTKTLGDVGPWACEKRGDERNLCYFKGVIIKIIEDGVEARVTGTEIEGVLAPLPNTEPTNVDAEQYTFDIRMDKLAFV
jgi:hypothetical protein